MIREFNYKDLDEVNKLLINFDYVLNEKSLDNDFLNILIYEENNIKGILVYQFIYDRIEIDYIIVKEDSRNKGIATKLLNYLKNLYKNITNISLEVRESNEVAINFYLKNGFKKVAKRKNYYNNEDGILMVKNLGD